MRLGSRYRLSSLRLAGVEFDPGRVLDVGCHDGAFLSTLPARTRIGVDIEPVANLESALIVQADGQRLPFPTGFFDQCVALDVIEHVPDARPLIRELARVTRSGGRLFLTTPSSDIRLFPPFLTGWISQKWGHTWRRGYARDELRDFLGDHFRVEIQEWNAPAYRLCYLPLRFLAVVFPSLSLHLVDRVARIDARRARGSRGFYWARCEKV